jgi:hypothetical protein
MVGVRDVVAVFFGVLVFVVVGVRVGVAVSVGRGVEVLDGVVVLEGVTITGVDERVASGTSITVSAQPAKSKVAMQTTK